MANITTREIGTTATGTALSNAELDNNFINLNNELSSKANITSPTFTGTVTVDKLSVLSPGGDEGGEINLALAQTNNLLNGSVAIDINQSQLRIFETGGTNRGVFINLASAGAGVGTNLLALDASNITSGTIDAARLPSYVDDVLEAANLAAFPAIGETGKIYVALNTNKTYRWSGSTYVYITSGAVDSVAGKTGVVTLDNSDITTALGFTPLSTAGGTLTGSLSVKDSIEGTTTVAGGDFKFLSNRTGFQSLSIATGALTAGTDKYVYIGTGTGNHSTSTTTIELGSSTTGSLVKVFGPLTATGAVTATSFSGSASGLTGLKTVNGTSIVGSGNIQIDGGVTSFNTRTGAVTLSLADVTGALSYTPVNKAGDTITGDLLNSAAYSAPNNASGAGTKILIRGSTGTGAAGTAGGNGHVEILGGGATSTWTDFVGATASARRGGILLKAGVAQGDAGNTYVAGSSVDLYAGTGTTNGTQVGFGGTVTIRAGSTTKTDGNTSSGGGLTLWGGRGTQSGYFSLGGGIFAFGSDLESSQSGVVNTYPGTATQGGETNITSGSYSAGGAQSYTSNSGGLIRLTGATTTTGGDISFYPGTVYSGISGGVAGQVKINNSIVLHAGNYSSYAQPLLVSGTTIKTINGTSVLGSGDIVITASASGVTTFNTRSGAVTLSSGDVTGALGYTPLSNATSYLPLAGGTLSGDVSLPFNTLTAYSTQTEQVNTSGLSVSSSVYLDGAWELYHNPATENLELFHYNYTTAPQNLLINGNVAVHAGNYTSYAAPASHTHTSIVSPNGGTVVAADAAFPGAGQTFQHSLAQGPDGNDGHILAMSWSNTASVYGAQIWLDTDPTNRMAIRSRNNTGVWNGWSEVLTSGNVGSYAAPISHTHDYLPLSGGTITGTALQVGTALTYDNPGGWNANIVAAGSVHARVRVRGSSYNSSGENEAFLWVDNSVSQKSGIYSSTAFNVNAAGGLYESGSKVLNSSNYTNYSPSLTGSGASGTWGISVTGSAGSAGWSTYSQVLDTRAGQYSPNDYQDNRATFEFTDQIVGGWHSAMTIQGWSNGYAAWQIIGGATTSTHDNWYLRSGVNTSWNALRTILHSGNYSLYALPLSGGTLSGPLEISTGSVGGNYNEGLRLTASNGGWAGITFGSTGLSGTPSSGWFAARNPSNQFIVSPGTSDGTVGLQLNSGGNALWRNNILLHAGNYTSYLPSWSTGVNANHLVQRDAYGYIYANHINFSTSESENPTINSFITGNGDGWSRKSSLAHVKNSIRDVADGTWGITTTADWLHSERNFPDGTLITTNIDYSGWSGEPFVLEIRGNSYGNIVPLDLQYQGYIYSDTLISHGGLSNGLSISGLVALNVGGNLCFWFPTQGYWNGYNVRVYVPYAGRQSNRVLSITGTTKPSGTKEVALSSGIRQSLHSGNYTSYALPLSGGTIAGDGYIDFGPNSSWAQTLRVGGNGHGGGTRASVVTTDGNLHLDAKSGGGIYLGYYTGGPLYATASNHIVLHAGNYNSYSPTLTGGGASGTWGIAISGNAATASLATSANKTNGNSGYTRVGYGMAPFYNWGGASAGGGAPSEGSYTTGIDVGSHPSDQAYGFQIACNMFNGNQGLWTRAYNSGFTPWVAVLDSSNYSNYAAPISHTHDYLPLSGGTLTDDLSFGSQAGTWISSNALYDSIGWNGAYGVYIGSNINGDTKYLYANGTFHDGIAFRTLVHSGNYTSYSPGLTGSGASGNWGINVTGSAGTFTNTSQNSQFNSIGVGTAASGTAGEIRASNNITGYYSSDIKFKENVHEITSALSIVNTIGGKYFDWTDAYIAEHGGADGYFIQKSDFGVIAQDVLKVFPRAVRTRPDGSLAVDYEKLSALAFAAINEQGEKIARLEALVELLINKDKS